MLLIAALVMVLAGGCHAKKRRQPPAGSVIPELLGDAEGIQWFRKLPGKGIVGLEGHTKREHVIWLVDDLTGKKRWEKRWIRDHDPRPWRLEISPTGRGVSLVSGVFRVCSVQPVSPVDGNANGPLFRPDISRRSTLRGPCISSCHRRARVLDWKGTTVVVAYKKRQQRTGGIHIAGWSGPRYALNEPSWDLGVEARDLSDVTISPRGEVLLVEELYAVQVLRVDLVSGKILWKRRWPSNIYCGTPVASTMDKHTQPRRLQVQVCGATHVIRLDNGRDATR